MKWLWDSLESKGKYSTILGLILGIFCIVQYIFKGVNGIEMTDGQRNDFMIGCIMSMCFLILPSIIELKSKVFTFTIKD